MSLIYKKYQLLKKESSNDDLFLFKIGAFYVFIAEDALVVSKILNLKLTHFCNNVQKCGFPLSSLDKYISKLNSLNYTTHIIDNSNDTIYTLKEFSMQSIYNDLINTILDIDVNNLSGIEALILLQKLQKTATKLKKEE